jgi:hypothetical protein
MPKRLQQKRTRGWRMLPNSRSCARPSRWGNPYSVEWWSNLHSYIVVSEIGRYKLWGAPDRSDFYPGKFMKEQAAQKAVELFRDYAIERLKREPDWLDPLRGLDNLYCYCAEDAPCHVDVIIELIER